VLPKLAGVSATLHHIERGDSWWIAIGALLEVLSFAGYIVLFRAVFVSDDGVGFDPSAPQLRARHLGLTSMEERAGALGGTLQVTSARGEGSSIRAEVPVDT